jgi:hypothetical protein
MYLWLQFGCLPVVHMRPALHHSVATYCCRIRACNSVTIQEMASKGTLWCPAGEIEEGTRRERSMQLLAQRRTVESFVRLQSKAINAQVCFKGLILGASAMVDLQGIAKWSFE